MSDAQGTVGAAEIKIALANKHWRDYFLTEVKSGSTYIGTGNRILDAVALKLSYTHPHITGYEVKVTRADFKRDAKFYTYLPLVHELYIVTPAGLVQREELPTEIGLMWYDPATEAIKVKKRPPPRDIEISVDMLLYIVYSRLDKERIPFYSTTAEHLRAWVDNKEDNYALAGRVKNKMTGEISRLESELRKADRFQNGKGRERYEKLMGCLEAHGMRAWEDDPAKWLDEQLAREYPEILDDVQGSVTAIAQYINDITQKINRAKSGAGKQEDAENDDR